MNPSTIRERERFRSPIPTPQALAWHNNLLWVGSRDTRRICAIDVKTRRIVEEADAPGIPWAAVGVNGTIRFTLGEGPEDDRYIRRFIPGQGFLPKEKISCPEFTGSYLSYDGQHLYLSQWYKQRILRLDANGNIEKSIEVGAEISGHVFVNGLIYVLRGTEKNAESWQIARVHPGEENPMVEDLATVSFACRSLTFDGENFWSNYRAQDTIICFAIPS